MKDIRTRIIDQSKFEESLKPAVPKNMLVELTNVCNHRCIFCTNRKMTRKKGYISETLLFKILSEAFSLGTSEVGFYTTGEPFMSKNLDKYVSEAKKIGFRYIYLTTNGELATPERLIPVMEAGLDSIKFSINAGSSKTYRKIHGSRNFNGVISNLTFLSEYRETNKLPFKIYVSCVITKQTSNEKEDLKWLVGSLVDDLVFIDVSNQGGMVPEANSLRVGDIPVREPPCSMLFNRFHITWEGYLSACCVDFQNYLVVADLNKISLSEAWTNETFINLRGKHLTNNLEGTLCYNCLYNKTSPVTPLTPEYATIWTYKC